MATRDSILKEVNDLKNGGQDLVRRRYLEELHNLTKNDVIIYFASYPCNIPNVPSDAISINLGDINGFMSCLNGLKGKKLDLIIHSPGGSLEATEQLVQYLRTKYSYIRAIIPQNAMSAASMLACACDEIVMGKHSAIGPIDPQMLLIKGNGIKYFLPAHSILEDFEQAKKDMAADPRTANAWVPKLIDLPMGFLDLCNKTIELSKTKVGEWLDSYMFSNDADKKGAEIASWLADFKEHKTHSRPINIELAKQKGLKVTALEDDQELQDKVLSVFHASMLTFDTTPCVKIIENHNGVGSFTVLQQQIQQGK